MNLISLLHKHMGFNAADSKTCIAAHLAKMFGSTVVAPTIIRTALLKGSFGSVELDLVHGVKANSLTLGSRCVFYSCYLLLHCAVLRIANLEPGDQARGSCTCPLQMVSVTLRALLLVHIIDAAQAINA